jgi:23S rRNA (pseudouridine1915-N3)-methyltransferase
MKISILAIGSIKSFSDESNIIQSYIKRLPFKINIKELEIKKKLPKEELIKAEEEQILNSIPKNNYIIVLDENGKNISSKEFSEVFFRANQDICFVLGGAYGLSCKIKETAHFNLSLGKMTWPHMLARTLLVEQIYRAYTIKENHPYHK